LERTLIDFPGPASDAFDVKNFVPGEAQ